MMVEIPEVFSRDEWRAIQNLTSDVPDHGSLDDLTHLYTTCCVTGQRRKGLAS